MLTGDKLETATCIAKSSRLVARTQAIHTFRPVTDRAEAHLELNAFRRKGDAALVITGESLEVHRAIFLCAAYVRMCCRYHKWIFSFSTKKASHTCYQALSPELIPVYRQSAHSHPPGDRLSLLSARPAVTFPATEHHRHLAGTKLYCLATESRWCEQLAQGCYAAFARSRIWTHDLLIASWTLYLFCHHATFFI